MPGDQTFSFLISENDAPHRVNRDDLCAQIVAPHVLSASADRAAGAYRTEQVVNFTPDCCHNLVHRLVMGSRVLQIRVLVGPETTFVSGQQILDAIEPSLKIFASPRMRLRDEINLSSIGLQKSNILQ